jgi:hypothetical protein
MARTKLIISVIFVVLAGQVLCYSQDVLEYVQIFPEHPTSSDVVYITLFGFWANNCVPNDWSVSISPHLIHFVADPNYPDPGICLPGVHPWELTGYFGPLEPGSYIVWVTVSTESMFLDLIVRPAGDIDMTYRVDFLDYALLAEAWMSEPNDGNWDAACDISEPNDGIIDGRDLGVLGENWLESVPGITYEVEQCDMLGGASGVLDGLRFTVWVEGDYIYFEDMMVANCCPERLWLEMVTSDNLIIINEKESGGMCLCICDWPVTARFGPFGDGVYTVEVYEDYGGFIGSTTVEIGGG